MLAGRFGELCSTRSASVSLFFINRSAARPKAARTDYIRAFKMLILVKLSLNPHVDLHCAGGCHVGRERGL
jgi:hypothetical protein